jgi:hypothetical protein
MKILKDTLRHAPNAKEPGIFLKEILCPSDIIYKSTYSMCGELTSWGPSKTHMDMSIS